VPAGAARDHGPVTTGAAGLLTGHLANPTPASVARDCGPAAGGAAGLLAKHGPLLVTRGCDPTDGLSAEHGPLRVTCGRGPAAAAWAAVDMWSR